MTKTYMPYITAGDLRPASDPSRAIDDSKNYMREKFSILLYTFGGRFLIYTLSITSFTVSVTYFTI